MAQHPAAQFLLGLPLLVAAGALLEDIFGASLGAGILPFTDQFGRPAANSILAFSLLAPALLLARRKGHASTQLANLLAIASLCFGLFSILPAYHAVSQIFVAPFPAALANVLLASAFLLWRRKAGWSVPLAPDRSRLPLIGLTLPLIIILPIVPVLVASWSQGVMDMTPPGASLLAVFCDALIVSVLLWVVVDRLAGQQAALREVRRRARHGGDRDDATGWRDHLLVAWLRATLWLAGGRRSGPEEI